MTRIISAALTAMLFVLPATSYAQDDDDVLDEILGETEDSEGSVRDERRALEEGDVDDRVGVKSDELLTKMAGPSKRRIIKTLQQKTFMKLGRFEVAPHVGFVTNDVFIHRYMFGVSGIYHITEIFGVEAWFTFSPDFGQEDWKAITKQLVNENKVSPDISKIEYFGTLSFQFSPIYGKLAVADRSIINFDVYGAFGLGVVNTRDDLKALQCDDENDSDYPKCAATEVQYHPTTNIGGGLRVIFGNSIAARIEGRSIIYVETIDSDTLEMKGNFYLAASVAFFFPGTNR